MSSRFGKAMTMPRLSREEQLRQGRVVIAAHAAFADVDAVRAFLNNPHDGLRARPLDVATASEAGLRRVEAMIVTMCEAR